MRTNLVWFLPLQVNYFVVEEIMADTGEEKYNMYL